MFQSEFVEKIKTRTINSVFSGYRPV